MAKRKKPPPADQPLPSVRGKFRGEIEKLLDHPLLEVMAVRRRVENPLGLAWSKDNIVEITPTAGFVDTIIGNNNLIVHKLLEERSTPYPVLLTLFRRTNGMIIVSLRSRGGEALKVAEKLQGGGHANAAGAVVRHIDIVFPLWVIEFRGTALNDDIVVGLFTVINARLANFGTARCNRRNVPEIENRQTFGAFAGDWAHHHTVAMCEEDMPINPGLGIGRQQ